MSDPYIPSVSMHQQNGGMSLQAFADLHGISLDMMRYYARVGRVVGARQDSRSKRWTVYPPAKLVDKSGEAMRPRGSAVAVNAECDTSRAAPPSGAGVMAPLLGHVDTYPAQAVTCAAEPPHAKPVLTLEAAALPGAARSLRARHLASCGKPEVYTEARSVCQALHEAAVRQYREGIHYLRLDAHELAQLYAALDNDRSRVRKLVGKGLLPVGLLRASDSVWQKMQAICREGRLL